MTKEEREDLRLFREECRDNFRDIRERLGGLEEAFREHASTPSSNDVLREEVKLDAKKVGIAGMIAGIVAILGYFTEFFKVR